MRAILPTRPPVLQPVLISLCTSSRTTSSNVSPLNIPSTARTRATVVAATILRLDRHPPRSPDRTNPPPSTMIQTILSAARAGTRTITRRDAMMEGITVLLFSLSTETERFTFP
uniref:Uncharacterized protein n=1 Tax=Cacopsylla melanoneura TaxID=428564 RepID=A0A8D8SBE2_9HEMI